MPSFSGVDHIGLCVSDIDRSLRFYRDLLGWAVMMDVTLEDGPMLAHLRRPGVKVRAVVLRKDQLGMIELLQVMNADQHRRDQPRIPLDEPGGGAVIALNCTGLDELYAELTAAGVEFVTPPNPDLIVPGLGKVKAAIFRDPDGHFIELIEAGPVSFNALA